MASLAVIHLETSWVAIDPDGSLCCGCGDVCFLYQWQFTLFMDGVATAGNWNLCASCYEVLQDNEKLN